MKPRGITSRYASRIQYDDMGRDFICDYDEVEGADLKDEEARKGKWIADGVLRIEKERSESKAELFRLLYGGPTDMKDYEALEKQAQRLLKYAEEARAERERFGEDDFPDGAVITFGKVFPGGTKEYQYAAIKQIHTGDVELWYTTGPKSPKGYTWDELVNWMGKGVKEIYYVSTLERFVG